MALKKNFLFFFLLLPLCLLYAEESDQQISDFSLAGYGDKGKKTWNLAGKSADIFEDVVKLKDLTGNLYGEKEDVRLTAERGDFNKTSGKIHVERNVVITTTGGSELTTESLDWDRVNSTLSTKDFVHISRQSMDATGWGAFGQPNLSKMRLERDVRVEIEIGPQPNQQAKPVPEVIVITCDGPLEVDYEKNIATFNRNVKADKTDSQIFSDIMEIYFSGNKDGEKETDKTQEASGQDTMMMGNKIDKIIAKGNVKTVRGENITYSQEAIYNGLDKRLILYGRPRLLIFSTEDFKTMMQ